MSSLLDRSPLFVMDFRPRTVDGLIKCPNWGRAAGAQPWFTLGDGATAGTLPIPLSRGYGAQFTGTQYVQCGLADRYERTDPYSIYAYVEVLNPAVAYHILLSTQDQAQVAKGVALVYEDYSSATCPIHYMVGGAGNQHVRIHQLVGRNHALQSIATNNFFAGGAPVFMQNAKEISNVVYSATLSNSIKSGKQFMIGARHNGAGIQVYLTGKVIALGLFDKFMSRRDMQSLDEMVESRMS